MLVERWAIFELLEQLGVGQFGTVWMARDTELDRTVAVKIPRQEQLSRDDVEMFMREARAAAQLHHPNIVSVHEVGRDGDTVFIVSDLVRGVTLADRMTARRLSPREAAQLCVTIAEAHHLTLEIVGANAAANPEYMVGLDCIRLTQSAEAQPDDGTNRD